MCSLRGYVISEYHLLHNESFCNAPRSLLRCRPRAQCGAHESPLFVKVSGPRVQNFSIVKDSHMEAN